MISRREFFKFLRQLTVASGLAGLSGVRAQARERENRTKGAHSTTTICPYCAVGCGMIAHTKNGKVINIEGDPEHPINQGSLCSKGASLFQIANNQKRVTKPRYRASGSSDWREVEWDWAIREIAKRIKKTRDQTFIRKNAQGQEVNRCNGIAHVGSAALDNEECYLLQKWLRSLGLVYIEHQARI